LISRVILIVLDSAGVGQLPDAAAYGDTGANTILHIHQAIGGLSLPNLCGLGLGHLVDLGRQAGELKGSYGKMAEMSPAKDTIIGHWEICGLVSDGPMPTFPDGFPAQLINDFEAAIGRPTLGNYASSGTVIMEKLGPEHLKTGRPIVYTSADSVFQITAHTEVIPLDELYRYCQTARELLKGPLAVGRVIARPFFGRPGSFERDFTGRKDYALSPPRSTLLDELSSRGLFTCGIGKIGDIFNHRGIGEEIHTKGNLDGIGQTLMAMRRYNSQRGMIFVNLVDFDMVYGHRRNPEGYAGALHEFDAALPSIMQAMSRDDLLIITADHGCDPTHRKHTDHTREYVPLLLYGQKVRAGVDLGIRKSFSDLGQSVAHALGVDELGNGLSFIKDILP
jgi:phosphopentomutase